MSDMFIPTRLVNKCMSAYFNANVSLNVYTNANAIFQERIQMQMQMSWLHIYKCILLNYKCVAFILTFCFIWTKIVVILAGQYSQVRKRKVLAGGIGKKE